uniref:C-type lectin domain-containing protein n=1 Tax=Panagrolaimus sp. JU765 TaxID=591449 RepID=A0AC34QVN6_9BILA
MRNLAIFCFVHVFAGILANPTCPYGTIPSANVPNACYLFQGTPKTYDDAEAACVIAGGHLAPVFDQFTNLMLTLDANLALKNSADFWIGARLKNIPNLKLWLWSWHNSLMNYANWAPGEPTDTRACVVIQIATATWITVNCNATKSYVCRVPATVEVCDDGWAFLEKTKSCYKMFANTSDFNFTTALELCQNQNAHVVSIHNEAENTMVGQLTSLNHGLGTGTVAVWIGLTYSNGAWNWTDGTANNYQAWGDRDPDNAGTQNCVNFYPDGAYNYPYENYVMKWDTSSCSNSFSRVVCKKVPKYVPISEKP